jgi:hypothetical protein
LGPSQFGFGDIEYRPIGEVIQAKHATRATEAREPWSKGAEVDSAAIET